MQRPRKDLPGMLDGRLMRTSFAFANRLLRYSLKLLLVRALILRLNRSLAFGYSLPSAQYANSNLEVLTSMPRLVVHTRIHHLSAEIACPEIFRVTMPESFLPMPIHIGLVDATHFADIADLGGLQTFHRVLRTLALILDDQTTNKRP